MRLSRILRVFLFVVVCLTAHRAVIAQAPNQPAGSDVLRINADLIQTELTVLDAKGRFVDGLTANQFELRVDGKPVPVSFFESANPPSGKRSSLVAGSSAKVNPTERSRTIVFFVDDLHLSALSRRVSKARG
ncbi:MAG TPA: hypothetical protein VJU84_16050 [Pyrinomonadaceae bacterium]|nr:hypothetical protein [Pyrinomonadaceae bacterium]